LLLEEIQKDINEQDKFIRDQNDKLKEAEFTLLNLKDGYCVFQVAKEMVGQLNAQVGADIEQRGAEEEKSLMDGKSISILRVAGVVDQCDIERLRRLIFRSTKGKSYMYNRSIEDKENSKNQRAVYIITFQDGAHIRERIQKICDSFSGQRYDLPEAHQLSSRIEQMLTSINNAKLVFENTRTGLRQQLIDFDRIEGNPNDAKQEGRKPSSVIYIYKMFLAKEKTLYQTLNMMKQQSTSYTGYFWAPVEYAGAINEKMQNQTATKIVHYDNHHIMPPTFNKSTDFTMLFQLIVDTYGIPTY